MFPCLARTSRPAATELPASSTWCVFIFGSPPPMKWSFDDTASTPKALWATIVAQRGSQTPVWRTSRYTTGVPSS